MKMAEEYEYEPEEYEHSRYSHINPEDLLELSVNNSNKDIQVNLQVFTTLPKSHYSTAKALHIHQRYGLKNCVKVIVGCTLGAGLFTTPNGIFEEVHNAAVSLCIWFAYGCVAWAGGLCYAELGTTFPVSSGDYAYLNESFGSFFGFLFQWCANLLFIPCVNAVLASVISRNLLFPLLNNFDPNVADWAVCLVTMAVLLFLAFITGVSPRLVEDIRKLTFGVKLAIIVAIGVSGFYYMGQHGIYDHTNFTFLHEYQDKKDITPPEVIRAIYQSSFSFLGFNSLNYITEELRDPGKNLPLAIFISMPIILGTYLFIIFCYFVVMDPFEITQAETIASDVIKHILPQDYRQYTSWLFPSLVAIAMSGTLLYRMSAFARVTFIGCRMGHIPKVMGLLSVSSNFPIIALIFSTIMSCLYSITKQLDVLMLVSIHIEMFFVCLCAYALIYMRIKHPDIQRPIKLPLIIPVGFALVTTMLFISPILSYIWTIANHYDESHLYKEEDEKEARKASIMAGSVLVLLSGVPAYFIFIWKKTPIRCFQRIHYYVMITAQKLLIALPEDSSCS